MISLEILVGILGGVGVPIIVTIFAFLWKIHQDVSGLRERMARLEGLFEGFTRRKDTPQTA